jgi:rubrerythrin
VNERQTEHLLQTIVRREGRCLLQYVGEAFPWTTVADEQELARFQQLVREHSEALAAIVRFMLRQHLAPPHLGPFAMGFTTINFVSFDYLLPRLVHAEREGIGQLERDLAMLTDAGARGVVEKLLDLKRQHLKVLEEMATAHAEPALR